MRRTLALALPLVLVGCGGDKPAQNAFRPKPITAPVLAAQAEKDKIVVDAAKEAAGIAPQVQPQTDAIIAAVDAAPAAEVAALVKQFEDRAKELEKSNDALAKESAKLKAEIADYENSIRKTVTYGGYALAALLCAAGIASFFLGAQIPYLGPQVGFALGCAGIGVFGLVRAYEWTQQHPWATAGIFIALMFAAWRAHKNTIKSVVKP